MKWSDMRHAMKMMARMKGVRRPQTGQSPRMSEMPQTTPMAVMTSDAKGNHGRVEGLCRAIKALPQPDCRFKAARN